MPKFLAMLAAAGLLVVAAPISWAGAGTTGAGILTQSVDARSAALAGAYAAVGGDLNSLGSNPAGLATLEGVQLNFLHLNGIEGQTFETLSAGVAVPGLGTLGARVFYQGQPAIDNQVPEPVVEVKDWLYGDSFARPILIGLYAGINARVLSSTLGPSNATVFVLDAGAQYELDPEWRLGAAARNLGQAVKYIQAEDPLPGTLDLGAAWTPQLGEPHTVMGTLDVDYLAQEKNATLRVGAEYGFKHLLALRLGYAHSATKQVDGITAGVGFRFKIGQVQMMLDYTLRPQVWEESDFEIQNLLSLGAKF